MDKIGVTTSRELAELISRQIVLIDARSFCEYNTSHISNAVNVWCSKIRKKRLQQNAVCILDLMQQVNPVALEKESQVIVYDQSSCKATDLAQDSFIQVLLTKLSEKFTKVSLLAGGYVEFQGKYPELCEETNCKRSNLTSISQPCLPLKSTCFTRILPFLYLGSHQDANNKEILKDANISYELNVSASCPKPTFLPETHFMRISVNDNFNEKLLPHFQKAFQFIDKVRESGERILVHCLAGVSRSPTVAIAYVMKHLRLHYDEAYRYVKQRRPTISPNINFVGQLLELDRILYGEHSVCRSPTMPLYFDQEYCFDVLPCSDSLVRKSSSSPCIDANHPRSHPKRSLPALLNDKKSCQVPSSPPTPQSQLFKGYTLHPLASEVSIPAESEATDGCHRKYGNVVNPMSVLSSQNSSEDSSSCKGSASSTKVFQKPPIPPEDNHQNDLASTSHGPKPLPRPKKQHQQYPRSHSSSETHISKNVLDSSAQDHTGRCARKSMSTDEMSKTLHHGAILTRENSLPIGSSELARCDSWSTSGLGSEISDWESVAGEQPGNEDTQGPFDAVFSEVFPGDGDVGEVRSASRTCRSASDHRVGNGTSHRCTHSCSVKCEARALCRSSSAPRPMSLPGVSHSINPQSKSSSIDMGVDVDDALDCIALDKEPNFRGQNFVQSHKTATKSGHPTTDRATATSMCQSLGESSTEKHLDSSASKTEEPPAVGYRLQKFSRFDPKRHTFCGQKVGDVHQMQVTNWLLWDAHFQTALCSPQQSFTFNRPPKLMQGRKMAEELVQSVEHLLESEIGDIKRQAEALRSRYGLIMDTMPNVSGPILRRGDSDSDCSDLTTVEKVPLSTDKSRAMSEPPLGEEVLYRAHSCPGLPQVKGSSSQGTVVFRSSRPPPFYRELNRFSCGALDSVIIPVFESGADLNKLKRHLLSNNSSSASACSSPSSYNRLLEVS